MLDYMPFWAWIAIIAIIGGITWQIINTVLASKERRAESAGATELRTLVAQNTELNQKLVEKLDTLDGRLAKVEQTLNDIP
jgi:hypothetical protein